MSLPLSGLRVLDVTSYISGPYAGSILASLGAEVIKIEAPGGDPLRRSMDDRSLYYRQFNAGKKSVVIDLKRPEGVAVLRDLLPHCDVFMENWRPGKMARLGLGPEDVAKLNPKIVYSSVSGFGDIGPDRDRPAYDTIGQAMSGFYGLMNDPGMARLTGTCISDLLTALISCMGILAGLAGRGNPGWERARTVQTSILEAMSTITIDAITQSFEERLTPTRESRHPHALNFCLRCSDGNSLFLHLSSSDKFWANVTRVVERPDLLEREEFATFHRRMAQYTALREILTDEFARQPYAYWTERLQSFDVPFAPFLSLTEALDQPQMRSLALLEDAEGATGLVRPPWRFGGERPRRPAVVDRIGEHTAEVLARHIGADRLSQLLRDGIVVQCAPRTGQPAAPEAVV